MAFPFSGVMVRFSSGTKSPYRRPERPIVNPRVARAVGGASLIAPHLLHDSCDEQPYLLRAERPDALGDFQVDDDLVDANVAIAHVFPVASSCAERQREALMRDLQ
jgi:hypothetical protein